MKCFICKKDLKHGDKRHIYFCASKHDVNVEKDELRYLQLCFSKNKEFTKSEIENLYLIKKWSLPDFEQKLMLGYSETLFLLRYFAIPSRSHKESVISPARQKKCAETCLKKYGVSNVSKLETIKNKKKQSFLLKYGVDNVWKSLEFKEWYKNHIQDMYGVGSLPNRFGGKTKWWEAISESERKEYGAKMRVGWIKWWGSLTEAEKRTHLQNRSSGIVRSYNSKLELKFEEALNKMGLSYQRQFWIKRRSYDFRLSSTQIIFEINGDYWHANPYIYKESDLITYPNGTVEASAVWKRDLEKKVVAEEYHYLVVYFWELEINSLDIDQLSALIWSRLEDLAGLSKNIIPQNF